MWYLFTYGQRVRWKKWPPSDFPADILHVTLGQIKWLCPWHWRKAGGQALYACEALLNLAVSEQITERFQFIVRPVLALVIRHAVLSEARAAGEVKRQWCNMRFCCSLAEVWLLLWACRLIGCGIVFARVMHSTLCKKDHCMYSCLEIHCYFSCECQTLAVQLEFDHLLSHHCL